MPDYPVTRVLRGSTTALSRGVLSVDADALSRLVLQDDRILDVGISVVNTSQSVRLIHVLDCMRPVCKEDGSRGVFPGVLCEVGLANPETTNRLRGVVVTALGVVSSESDRFSQKEAIIDVGGATPLSPLSSENHVVLELECKASSDELARQHATAKSLAAVAEHLAEATIDSGCEDEGIMPQTPDTPDPNLVRLAHVCQVSASAPLFDTRLLGRSLRGMLPTLVSHENLVDGWLVSGDYHYASTRNVTSFYQDNALREAASNGRTGEVVVTVLMPIADSQEGKERAAVIIGEAMRSLGIDGVVITGSATGNAQVDMMLTAEACEKRGVSSSLMMVELAGVDGADGGLVSQSPSGDMLVSTGNREEVVALPACDSVLGGTSLLAPGGERAQDPRADLKIPLLNIVGANSQLGCWYIGCQQL